MKLWRKRRPRGSGPGCAPTAGGSGTPGEGGPGRPRRGRTPASVGDGPGGAVTGGGGRGRVERRDAIRQPCRRPRGPLPRHVPPLPPAPRQGSPPAAAAVPLTVSPPRLLLLLRLARQRRRRPFSGRLLPQPSLREEGARASDAGTPHGRRRAPPSRPACAQLHLRACVPPLGPRSEPARNWVRWPGWGGASAATQPIGGSLCPF